MLNPGQFSQGQRAKRALTATQANDNFVGVADKQHIVEKMLATKDIRKPTLQPRDAAEAAGVQGFIPPVLTNSRWKVH